MASTFFGLTISYTGLQAAATSINVTAHNIANINTEGYSKQQAAVQANDAIRCYAKYGTLVAGVNVTAINQLRDSYYDDKYRTNETLNGEYSAKNTYMAQIENYLNEFTLKGYCVEYEDFFKAVNQMTLTPGDTTAKNSVVNKAASLADYFNTLSTNFTNMQKDVNNEVKDSVEQINSIAQNIASLNKQINYIEASYGNANDLRDQRSLLIDNLSKIVNVDVSEQDMGNNLTELKVYVNGQTLVAGYQTNELETVARTDDEQRNYSDAQGLYDIRWKTTEVPFNIYSSSLGGQLKALIDLRDGCNGEIEQIAVDADGNEIKDSVDGYTQLETVNQSNLNTTYKGIPYYQAQFNQFVSTFAENVNSILKSGFTADNQEGISLFETPADTTVMSATNITVSEILLDDPDRLASKSSIATGEANADIMEKLYQFQSSTVFDGGTGAYFLESIVSDMSIDASRATNMELNYTNLKKSIQNQRLSVMGVDTDEEAMDLMKFQQTYNLNSKMMSVMNEIYDKLINGTGV